MNRPRMLGQAGGTYGRHWPRRNEPLAPRADRRSCAQVGAQDRRKLPGGMCLSLFLCGLPDSRERPVHSTASNEDPARRRSHRAWSPRLRARLARLCRVRCSSIRRFIPPAARRCAARLSASPGCACQAQTREVPDSPESRLFGVRSPPSTCFACGLQPLSSQTLTVPRPGARRKPRHRSGLPSCWIHCYQEHRGRCLIYSRRRFPC